MADISLEILNAQMYWQPPKDKMTFVSVVLKD